MWSQEFLLVGGLTSVWSVFTQSFGTCITKSMAAMLVNSFKSSFVSNTNMVAMTARENALLLLYMGHPSRWD